MPIARFLPIAFFLLATGACQPASDAAGTPTPPVTRVDLAPDKPVIHETTVLPAAETTSRNISHWQCDEILLDLHEESDTARIDFNGRSLTLQHGESLVGARYSDRKGNAFTRDGDHATLALASGESHACTPSSTASPWSDAAARGVTFRAIGNEPGWWVEIARGATPALHAMLDYGDRSLDVAEIHSTSDHHAGRTADGVAVLLIAARRPCHDGMSGALFEATATLTTGDKVYRGCGAFLDD